MAFNVGDRVRVKSTGMIHKVISVLSFKGIYILSPPWAYSSESDLEPVPESK